MASFLEFQQVALNFSTFSASQYPSCSIPVHVIDYLKFMENEGVARTRGCLLAGRSSLDLALLFVE